MPLDSASAQVVSHFALRESALRMSPDFELVRLEQLTAQQQESLSPLRDDPNFYGVVRSRVATGLSSKSVSSETAALLVLLREPGRLPDEVIRDGDAMLAIARLICDGILQIERGSEWICGPAACDANTCDVDEEPGMLAGLSLRALKHAAALATADTAELCAHLYCYNTVPLTPQWLRRFPDSAAVQEYLQIQAGGYMRWHLDRDWARVSPAAEQGAWLAWTSRTLSIPRGAATYKLYLSPFASQLREAFRAWLGAITQAEAFHFKIGSDIRGLLRPDKMVAYFGDRAALEEAAQLAARDLAGCPAQGVPFTAELSCGALMSWGTDPPLEEAMPVWLRRQSWRLWICNRLGAALAVAKHHGTSTLPAWRFALERLRLDGVDISTWTPVATGWEAQRLTEAAAS